MHKMAKNTNKSTSLVIIRLKIGKPTELSEFLCFGIRQFINPYLLRKKRLDSASNRTVSFGNKDSNTPEVNTFSRL